MDAHSRAGGGQSTNLAEAPMSSLSHGIDTAQAASRLQLNLGCGPHAVEGWVNLDGSWGARLAKHRLLKRALRSAGILPAGVLDTGWSSSVVVHDVRKRLPFGDSLFSAVYASHLLEHVYFNEGQRLLAECFRVLRAGGVLRMVVPDLRAIITEYVSSPDKFDGTTGNGSIETSADRVNHRLLFRGTTPPGGSALYRLYSSSTDFHSHKWMYDAQSLTHHLRRRGFVQVTQRGYRESRISDIASIEQPGRVLNGEGVCVEGVKPA